MAEQPHPFGQPDDLHHEDGSHRWTARTTNGRDLERHEARIRAHVADRHHHPDDERGEVVDTQAPSAYPRGGVAAVWALDAGEVADTLDALEGADVAACSWCEEAGVEPTAAEHDSECPFAGHGRFAQIAGTLRRLAGIGIDEDAHAWASERGTF